jgi:hypothetical protein
VLLVPSHAVALVSRTAQDLDDLAAPWLASADHVDLDPIAGLWVRAHFHQSVSVGRLGDVGASRFWLKPVFAITCVAR